MLNNGFVEYNSIELKQPVVDFSEIESYFNNNLFNPYSDLNLQITGTSFLPKEGLYDSLLGNISETTESTTTSVSDNGDVRAYAKNWLMQNENLTNEQASALAGVFWAESRLNPSIHEKGKENNPYAGQGIPQWTGKSRLQHAEDIYKRIFGKSKSIKQMSLEEQLKVAVEEFKERGTWQLFLKAKDIKTATDIVWRGYENGYNQLASHDQMKKTYGTNYNKLWQDRFRYATEISKI